MDCTRARAWIFKLLDGELPAEDEARLAAHTSACAACARDLKLLALPRRLGQAIPVLEPSPFFYRRLRARLESAPEYQGVTIWQILVGLSRQVVPALASITLALVSVFIYQQLRGPSSDYQAYDSIFLSGERPQSLVIAALGDLTDESVLSAITEPDSQETSADAGQTDSTKPSK
jgi:hypothetical protein